MKYICYLRRKVVGLLDIKNGDMRFKIGQSVVCISKFKSQPAPTVGEVYTVEGYNDGEYLFLSGDWVFDGIRHAYWDERFASLDAWNSAESAVNELMKPQTVGI